MRRCERNNAADTQVSEEGGGGGAPDTRAEILLQPVEKTMVRQAVPLQPMEDDGGAEIPPAAQGGPHARAGGCLKEAVAPWKGPTLEQLVKNCSPREGLTLEKVVEDCLLWEGPHAGVGEECEESSP